MINSRNFDVIIIGGSYAGLSAAMSLGRSLRKVLIIDSGLPCNRQTPHSHNFITHDGETPAAIAANAKAQVLKYPTVAFLDGFAVTGKQHENGFIVSTAAGDEFQAKKLIFATGIADQMPDIEGFSACWGISVVHCPYCHGYEIRNQKTGILANGKHALHVASLVNNLTGDLTVLTNGKADFDAEELARLNSHGINVVETEVAAITHENGYLKNIVFKDGSEQDFQAVYAGIPFKQHSDIPVSLGCELTEHGHIQVDNFQQTTVEGVYACGDNTTMMRAVANAVASGNLTGAMVNKALIDEQF